MITSAIKYISELQAGKLLLWCYLIWYLSISTLYFDSDPELWLTALGISLIVGCALVLSTTCWPVNLKALDRWQTMRLFLIPFCVSSYSMLIKDQNCYLIFPQDLKIDSIAVLSIISFLLFVSIVKKTTGGQYTHRCNTPE